MFFFFNDTATTEIYTLSLHDALPIYPQIEKASRPSRLRANRQNTCWEQNLQERIFPKLHRKGWLTPRCLLLKEERSEEHTSELQSRQYLVCRLLLEKKKNKLS